MWSVVVALPTVQAEFGGTRAGATLPWTLVMAGFASGGIVLGRMVDRVGILPPVLVGAACLLIGYGGASIAPDIYLFSLAHIFIGFGGSAGFAPMMADMSHWFVRRRGVAIAIAASGNYLAGAIWPPLFQQMIEGVGWRQTHLTVGLVAAGLIVPLSLLMRRRAPHAAPGGYVQKATGQGGLDLPPGVLQGLLIVAGIACCVAMSMPQVHIVAYCGDLGYGVARGAEMLALMMAAGIVSRVASGWIADRIGGLATLLLGSALQAVALALYLGFDSLASLYVISALFGLFQGGIVPSYAVIIREYFPPHEAGRRVGLVVMATIFGMALGGWLSGLIFDLTGSYTAAFLNGVGWNAVNMTIVFWLILRANRRAATA